MSVSYGQVKGRKHPALQPLPPAPEATAPAKTAKPYDASRPVVADGSLRFSCAREAADALGVRLSGVRKALRGVQSTCGGHTFEYEEDAS